MKVPVYITVLILTAGSVAAWYQHSASAGIRANHMMLVAKAAEQGIVLDPEHPTKRVRFIDRSRDNRIVEARQTASDIIDFHAELKTTNLVPGSSEEKAAFERWKEIMKPFATFDTSQIKIVISTLSDSTRIPEDRRNGIIHTLIFRLKERDPEAVLKMLCEMPELLPDDFGRNLTITDSFSLLAQKDLNGMIGWLKANEAKLPDGVSEECKTSAIWIAAQGDPRQAFELIRELGVKDPDLAVCNIAEAARDKGQRTVALKALREYLPSISDELERKQIRHRGVAALANKAAEEGFENGTRWIAEAGLSSEELESLPQGFELPDKSTESGKWIEWLAETVPGGATDEHIRYLVSKWTTQDHRAAGEWLAAAGDSQAKTVAVRAFAQTIARQEPDTAIQWAATLPTNDAIDCVWHLVNDWAGRDEDGALAWLSGAPEGVARNTASQVMAERIFPRDRDVAIQWALSVPPGPDRDRTLKRLYDAWPKNTDAAKAEAHAFAKESGIEP